MSFIFPAWFPRPDPGTGQLGSCVEPDSHKGAQRK